MADMYIKGVGHDGSGDSLIAHWRTKLKTLSTTVSMEHYSNHHDEEAYQSPFQQSATAGGNCIYFLKNDSDKTLIVEGMLIAVDAACEIYFQRNAKGTRNGATALTPVNLNFGSNNVADCTCEKGADLDGGSATLTGGTECCRVKFNAAKDSYAHNFPMDIVIPKNQTFSIWASSATPTITGVIPFYFQDKH